MRRAASQPVNLVGRRGARAGDTTPSSVSHHALLTVNLGLVHDRGAMPFVAS
jgi:hypothetical protein